MLIAIVKYVCVLCIWAPQQTSNGPFSETEKDLGVGLLFHENDLAPLFHPLSALFLKETTLSGSKWFLEILEKV